MRRLRKLICFALSILILLNFTYAFATSETEVCSDTIYAEQGKTVTMPIKIRNNTGVMGFKLTFKYPDCFESPEVLRGALLNGGLINDSITQSTEGSFDVVWCDMQNVSNDGTILLLSFKVDSQAENGKYKIDIFCSQEDTFNEEMQDVVFVCKPIDVIIGGNTDKTTKSENSQNVIQKPIEEIDSLFLKRTFENVLDYMNIENFDSMTDEDFKKFKEIVSKELLNYGASGNELYDKSKEEFEEIYNEAVKDAFADSVVNTVDGNVIDNAVKENLDTVGAENIESIPPEKQKEFVDGVVNALAENGAEIEKLPDSFSNEEAIKVIESVVNKNESETGKMIDDFRSDEKSKKQGLYIVVGVAAVAIIATAAVFIIKRKNTKKTNEEDKQ